MASFKDKIKKNKAPQSGERVFFPKTLGFFTIPNPRVDKREYQPEVISIPPMHRTSNITFKGDTFPRLSYWLGLLYKEPIVVNVGTFPATALYKGSDDLIFPTNKNGFDKKIPMVGDEYNVTIPEVYDLLMPISDEREKLLKKLKGATVSDKMRAYVEKELKKLEGLDNTAMIRTTHDVRMTPRVYIPVLMADVEEIENENGDIDKKHTPVIALFEQNLGLQFTEALLKSKKIEDKYDPIQAADYLFSEAEGNEGQPILIFGNPLAKADKTDKAAYCIKEYTDKPSTQTSPYFNLTLEKDIDERTFLRIILLEMIGLYPSKEDKDSIEALLKNAIFEEIKGLKGDQQ